MRRKIFYLALFVGMLHTSLAISDTDLETKVQKILSSATIRNHPQHVKELSRLGKPVVPILLQILPTSNSQVLILNALQRLDDPSSVLPLLAYLDKLDLTSPKQVRISNALMSALKELEDRRTEQKLVAILRDPRNLIANRLYAATALARFATEPTQVEVRDFVFHSPLLKPGAVSPTDLDTAYFEVGTEEAMKRLQHSLETGLAYEQLFIIDLCAANQNPARIEFLFRAAENSGMFVEVRHRAAEALVRNRDNVPKDRLLNALYSLRSSLSETSNTPVNQKTLNHWIEQVQKN